MLFDSFTKRKKKRTYNVDKQHYIIFNAILSIGQFDILESILQRITTAICPIDDEKK